MDSDFGQGRHNYWYDLQSAGQRLQWLIHDRRGREQMQNIFSMLLPKRCYNTGTLRVEQKQNENGAWVWISKVAKQQ